MVWCRGRPKRTFVGLARFDVAAVPPELAYPSVHGVQGLFGQSDAEVLVIAVERKAEVGLLQTNVEMRFAVSQSACRRKNRSRALMLAVRPMLIVPRRVFVRKCLKPRKVKVAGLVVGRPVPSGVPK
jgi:hypothetical protein